MEETPWFLLPKYQSLYNAYQRGSVEKIKGLLKKEGQTSLSSACLQGLSDVALLLINKGDSSELNITDMTGRTPLFWACVRGLSDVAQLLINKGASLDVIDQSGCTPLSLACVRGLSDVAQLLINKGASFDMTDRNGRTPLSLACVRGLSDVAQLLINKGACFDVTDGNGRTPLSLACVHGLSDVAQLLINKGANFDVTDRNGRTPLFWACESGLSDVAQLLINKGASFDVTDGDGCTPLSLACERGLSGVAQLLINKGANFDVKDGLGRTPLSLACAHGLSDVSQLLINKGTSFDVTDGFRRTPLSWACENGHSDVAQLLINKGASFDMTDDDGHTPLLLTCIHGHSDVAQLLINRGASFDVTDDYGRTPLLLACENGLSDVAQLLINKGASFDVTDGNGRTPLSLACVRGLTDVAQLLINKGASFDVTDEFRRTPLSWACENGHSDVARLLINKGASFDVTDGNGCTPLFWACENCLSDVAQLLINKGASFDVTDESGHTPLSLACENGLSDVAQLLINKGANFDVTDMNGHTPLSLACVRGLNDVAQLLIYKGASFNVTDRNGHTPLSWACESGLSDVAQLLINIGASFDVTDRDGKTPLLLACAHGLSDVAQLLINKGASYDVTDRRGRTPLSWACENGHSDVAQLLINRGASFDVTDDNGRTPLSWACENGHSNVSQLLINKGASFDVTDESVDIDDLKGEQDDSLVETSEQYQQDQETPTVKDKHVEAFVRAIREKGSLSFHMVQCLPFGPPCVGKTCLYHCLLDKQPPGTPSTIDTPGTGSLSTYVLTGRKMIQVKMVMESQQKPAEVIVAKGRKWSEVTSLPEEIAIYLKSIEFQCKPQSREMFDNFMSSKTSSENLQTSISALDTVPSKETYELTSSKDENTTKPPLAGNTTLDDTVVKALTEHVSGGDVDMDNVQDLLDNSLTIFYTDTGGQPEFHEVLPALVAGPTIFLLVFSLLEPLNSLYKVTFKSAANEYEIYNSSFSVKDVLMCCVSSIRSYHDAQLRDVGKHQSNANKYTKLSPPPTSVLTVGTHSDLVSVEDIHKVDQELKSVLGNKAIIEYFNENELVIPINNFNSDDGCKVREVIDRVVNRMKAGVSPYKIEIPVHWLGLELYLRQKKSSTVSLSECLELGKKFNIQEEELTSCLWFLHYKTGTIRYYSMVDELKDTVITEPNIIFVAVTEFITSTFTLKYADPEVCRNFKTLGLFSSNEVEFIFDRHKKTLGITYEQFTALLSHLNILVPAHDTKFDFFLPCALVHAPESDTDSISGSNDILVIFFDEGFVPKGIFSGLLGSLCKKGWEITYNADGEPQLFRNKVVLSVEIEGLEYSIDCKITATSTNIEFMVVANCKEQMNVVFLNIQQTVKTCMQDVCSRLQYGEVWNFVIICEHPNCRRIESHFARVDEIKKKAKCMKTKRAYQLRGKDCYWFSKSKKASMAGYSKDLIQTKRKQIRNCTEEPYDMLSIVLKQDESFSVHQSDQVLESEHQESTGNSPVSSRSSSEDEKQDSANQPICLPDDSILSPDAPTILAVMDATKDITNWSTLALLLGLSLADFDRIVANEHEALGQQMGIIRKWIDSGTASWAVLVAALKNDLVGKQAVANTIAKKYPKKSQNKRSASDRCLKGESSHGRAPNKTPKTESISYAREIDAQSNRDSDEDSENLSTERLTLCKARKRVHEPYNTGKGIVSKEEFSVDRKHGKQPDTDLYKYQGHGARRHLVEQKDEFQYVPLLKNLESVLQNGHIYHEVFESSNQSNPDYMCDFCDGQCFQDHPLFGSDKQALQIILYWDDVEVANPLGSYRGVHKLSLFYYFLGNITPKLRSVLKSTFLLACVTSKNAEKYGLQPILKPFIEEVNMLTKGVTMTIQGQTRVVKGGLLYCLADTLAAHHIGGFKIGVGFSLRKCRMCMATKDQISVNFRSKMFVTRTPESYNYQCLLLDGPLSKEDSITYGINFSSPLNLIDNFHVVDQLPQDIMHILLEGVVPYEMVHMLLSYITDEKFISIELLNDCIAYFSYSSNELKDKPSQIKWQTLSSNTGKNMNQSSSQMWLLASYLPLMIGDLIPLNDEKWECFLLLLDILQICTAKVLTSAHAGILEALVDHHHTLFTQCYPHLSITPKMHYMVHFPQQLIRIGPFINVWCMRMEAKNSYCKKIAQSSNFKNVPYTVANRHQRLLCSYLNDPDGFFDTDVKCGPIKSFRPLEQEDQAIIEIVGKYIGIPIGGIMLSSPKWITFMGVKYSLNDFVIIGWEENDLPSFGQIMEILSIQETTFLRLRKYKTFGIVMHYHSFSIKKTDDDTVLLLQNIRDHQVYQGHRKECSCLYITVRSHVEKY